MLKRRADGSTTAVQKFDALSGTGQGQSKTDNGQLTTGQWLLCLFIGCQFFV